MRGVHSTAAAAVAAADGDDSGGVGVLVVDGGHKEAYECSSSENALTCPPGVRPQTEAVSLQLQRRLSCRKCP